MNNANQEQEIFANLKCNTKIQLSQYVGSHLADRLVKPWDDVSGKSGEFAFGGGKWQCRIQADEIAKNQNAIDLVVHFELIEGAVKQVNAGITFSFDDWSTDNYVLMPAAVYNGNRFDSRRMEYPPLHTDVADIGVDAPTIVSDIPRLNSHDGKSEIQLLARDLATPAIGFHAPKTGKGFWCLNDEHTEHGPIGMFIKESDDRKRGEITILSPGVREDVQYTMCNTQLPSQDRGADLQAGDEIVLRMRLFCFECPEIQSLYDYFVGIRKDLTEDVVPKQELPFSEAWKLLEEKHNRDNWVEEKGYYPDSLSILGSNGLRLWRPGWCGGLMVTAPLLSDGDETSRQRVLRNLDFAFQHGQSDCGFFRNSTGESRDYYGDSMRPKRFPHANNWHLTRKSADVFYFIFKHFALLDSEDVAMQPKAAWLEGTRKCADAFVRLWKQAGQFGQRVDIETGKLIVGGSASASLAIAGLALASQYFDCDEYLEVATASGDYYYENFVKKGITTGGPGDAMQCPDSESAFGLLESFVVLYEVTGDEGWVKKACDMAHQCATWVTSYDFEFPPESTFGRLGMSAIGTVWANTQNKHSAPGICTLSGSSLLKLYRATNNSFYLELIREIAHSLPQYVSREDRSICDMPSGWINERVNLGDWEGKKGIGEVFYGACWPEVSAMLTYTELPGVYIQPDTATVCAFDNIDAKIVENTEDKFIIELGNPTKFEASVKVFVENSTDTKNIFGYDYMSNCSTVVLAPVSSHTLEFMKTKGK
ncbi:MAG: hypothetical protein KOO69_02205 [Victivallales bacterium]|nr:hypothetical protein [Victivallales bacterium]